MHVEGKGSRTGGAEEVRLTVEETVVLHAADANPNPDGVLLAVEVLCDPD